MAEASMQAMYQTDTVPRPDIPGEILEHICSYIASDTPTLSILLRVSKSFCRIAAPLVYRHVSVTPNVDLSVDTGLPPDLLDGTGMKSDGEEVLVEGDSPTLKRTFLRIMRTLDIYPLRPAVPLDHHQSTQNMRLGAPLKQFVPFAFDGQLRLRLDTGTHERLSPSTYLRNGYIERGRSSPREHFLPRRLIVHGAGFHQTDDPFACVSTETLMDITEIIVVITPGATPKADRLISMHHGLPFILSSVINSAETVSVTARPRDRLHGTRPISLTFVVQTPGPGVRFPPIDPPPHGGMPMTMDYHPDYAPGYLHRLTTLLGQRLVVLRQATSPRILSVGTVRFVNFGALDGAQVGMPQAAVEEMQSRFEKGLRIRLGRAGLSPKAQDLEVIGMKEWLDGLSEGGEDVLDEHILQGWRLRSREYR
jgi:hypothetical protein